MVLAVAALAFAAAGVCLIGELNPYGLIPAMPYASALVFALALLALCALTACGCIWYIAFLRQSVRAFCRFQSNALANANGRAALARTAHAAAAGSPLCAPLCAPPAQDRARIADAVRGTVDRGLRAVRHPFGCI